MAVTRLGWGGRVGRGARDAFVVARRNLRVLMRKPPLFVPAIVQPIVFLLLFKYVFGGVVSEAVTARGVSYTDLLVPAAIFITVAFGMAATATGMAEDLSRGLVDRFRSLPMSQAAVLAGRTLADTAKAAIAVVLIAGVGVLLGFRPEAGAVSLLAAFALAIGFGFAFSWIAAWIGTVIGNAEAAPAATLMWLFPLTFASSAFVPVDTFASGLQAFAEINPITHFIDAVRVLTLDLEAGTPTVPTERPVVLSMVWLVVILTVFIPLAVRAYGRRS
jgi:ABC-2 type transport system permease protein/oleandomycin transport system permease protein